MFQHFKVAYSKSHNNKQNKKGGGESPHKYKPQKQKIIMTTIKTKIQIVAPLRMGSPYLKTIDNEYSSINIVGAKLKCLREIRKIAKKESFQFVNILLQTKETHYIYLIKIIRKGGNIYFRTFSQFEIEIPEEYQDN